MADIFGDLIPKEPVFKEGKEACLKPTCVPETLLHRDGSLKSLASYVVDSLIGGTPADVILYGNHGTGKTALVRHLGYEFEKEAKKLGKSAKVVYANGARLHTDYRILNHVANHFAQDRKDGVPFVGLSAMGKLQESLKSDIQPTVIILDHLERMQMRHAEAAAKVLKDVKDVTGRSDIALIGVSQTGNYRVGAMERQNFKPLKLEGYDKNGMRDILGYHAGIAFADGVAYADAIERILFHLLDKNRSCDLGRGMSLLHQAGKVAQDIRSKNIDASIVDKSLETLLQKDLSEKALHLPKHLKYAIIGMMHFLSDNGKSITTGEAYEAYSSVAVSSADYPVTQRHFSGLLTEIGQMGILGGHETPISKGRYGRTRELSLNVPSRLIAEELGKDPFVSEVMNVSKAPVSELARRKSARSSSPSLYRQGPSA